jgi:hypothetical protein
MKLMDDIQARRVARLQRTEAEQDTELAKKQGPPRAAVLADKSTH